MLPWLVSADAVPYITSLLLIVPLVSASTIPRVSPRGPSAFNNGKPRRNGLEVDPTGSLYCNGPYGIDTKAGIPFSRANRGKLLFYGKGEGNTPDDVTDQWVDQGGVDDPKQSACGIPHNAYSISHVAIHPYWLKYAPLDRYCRPDICISFWDERWQTDMMLKVTDICSTDPSKPNSCLQPGDIKIDRTKAKIWSGQGGDPRQAKDIPGLGGDAWDKPTIWFFRHCWADGMMQDAYDHDQNWFARPKFYNNLGQTMDFATSRYRINQVRFPENQRHNNCAYNTSCQGNAIEPYRDWSPSSPEPAWEPICGGQGFSGKRAPPSTQCPEMQGVGGTPDTAAAFHQSDLGHDIVRQVESQGRNRVGTATAAAGGTDYIGSDSDLHISLNHVKLDAGDPPSYEALSYTWGGNHLSHTVFVDTEDGQQQQQSLPVTENLHAALLHLRDTSSPRTLWIDAICINQDDKEERSQQVARMGDIYKSAAKVIIWLGPEGGNSTAAIHALEELASKINVDWTHYTISAANQEDIRSGWLDLTQHAPFDDETWFSVVRLLNRSWFSRLWIWQEVFLAHKGATMICGHSTITWEHFRKAILSLYRRRKPDR
ncbi:MAG: hypothetical protein LQ341_006283, partial [Variospora aurantia]